MNEALETIAEQISARFGDKVARIPSRCGELTFEVAYDAIVEVCRTLRDDPALGFEQLVDLCGVDYLTYGRSEWNTETATFRGFSRGVDRRSPTAIAWERADVRAGDLPAREFEPQSAAEEGRRFAVVYHLLSVSNNRRLRLRAWCPPGEPPLMDSVIEVWKGADWFEREAFDLYGILFRGHPDLRRLLTDYGFLGHPFRKDFPLIGNVEVRYDPARGRVVYEPVSIEPRTLVPRVIREDNRYEPALKDAPRNG
jgi:NADH-quinone oxidoreductase subunit C